MGDIEDVTSKEASTEPAVQVEEKEGFNEEDVQNSTEQLSLVLDPTYPLICWQVFSDWPYFVVVIFNFVSYVFFIELKYIWFMLFYFNRVLESGYIELSCINVVLTLQGEVDCWIKDQVYCVFFFVLSFFFFLELSRYIFFDLVFFILRLDYHDQ